MTDDSEKAECFPSADTRNLHLLAKQGPSQCDLGRNSEKASGLALDRGGQKPSCGFAAPQGPLRAVSLELTIPGLRLGEGES